MNRLLAYSVNILCCRTWWVAWKPEHILSRGGKPVSCSVLWTLPPGVQSSVKSFFHQRLTHHPVARLACARESQPVLGLEKWMVRWSAGSPTHYRQLSREGSPGDRGGERQRGRPPRAAASAEACPRPSQAAGDLQVLGAPPGSCVVVLPNPTRHDGPPPLFHPLQCCLFLPSELSYSLHLISEPFCQYGSKGSREQLISGDCSVQLKNSCFSGEDDLWKISGMQCGRIGWKWRRKDKSGWYGRQVVN